MNPEILVLKFLLSYENYQHWRGRIDSLEFSKDIRPFLFALDSLFSKRQENVHPQELGIEVYKQGKKDRELIGDVCETLQTAEPPESVKELLHTFSQAKLYRDLSVAAYEAAEGGKPETVLQLVDQLDKKEELETEFVTDDINEILSETVKTPGLRWRLDALNRSLGSLRQGDFGFIFARPETGKTTLLASEVTYMAGQATGPVIWFNNEERGIKVKLRAYQASLGATQRQLVTSPTRAQEAYLEKTKGNLKIVDSPTITKAQVEAICKAEKPSLIIFDQLDKIKGFKADREDLMLGEIYIWARELAKMYCPVIGVSQADGTAEGIQWLNMGHVANAKTAKQAEADWIFGIGKLNQPGFEFNRYLSICKNKLTGDEDSDPLLRHGRLEVIIDPERARYEDIS